MNQSGKKRLPFLIKLLITSTFSRSFIVKRQSEDETGVFTDRY